jgi:hypothetical protein
LPTPSILAPHRPRYKGWLAGTTLELVSVSVNGSRIDTIVEGVGEPRSAEELAARLAQGLGRPVQVKVRIIDVRQQTAFTPG